MSKFQNQPFFQKSYKNNDYHGGGGSYGNYNKNFQNDGLGRGLKPVDWSKVQLEEFQKVFYLPSEHILYSREEVQEFKKQKHIFVKTKHTGLPDPMITWEDTKFPDYIIEQIKRAQFKQPTIIQSIAFPIVMSGHDFIGIAQTGSGKTLAYLLPGVIHINAQAPIEKGDGPIVLVLAPTRELAQQIEEQCRMFGTSSQLSCACIFGGVQRGPQQGQLLKGTDIIIATPGRLIDFLETGTTNMRRVTYLVLDEADRMLDMGFEPQIRKIVEQIRPDRQTLMFSATWPKEVRNLARDFCNESPLHIQIGDFEHSINKNINQIFEVVDRSTKPQRLLDFLGQLMEDDKVLIFCQTKNGCDDLFNFLKSEQFYRTMVIHGDKKQDQRDYVMDCFKNGKTRMLIATDVASRGLDVKDITHVINFDFPKQIEDYIHRIGRTGRAGKMGTSISFLQEDEDQRIAADLIEVLQEAGQQVPDIVYEISAEKRRKYDNRPKTGGSRSNYGGGSGGGYYGNHNGRNTNFSSGTKYESQAPDTRPKEYVPNRPATAVGENSKFDEDFPQNNKYSVSKPPFNNNNSFYNNNSASSTQFKQPYNNNYEGGQGGFSSSHEGGAPGYRNNYNNNNNNNTSGGNNQYNNQSKPYQKPYNNNNSSNNNNGGSNTYNKPANTNVGESQDSTEKPKIKFFNSKLSATTTGGSTSTTNTN